MGFVEWVLICYYNSLKNVQKKKTSNITNHISIEREVLGFRVDMKWDLRVPIPFGFEGGASWCSWVRLVDCVILWCSALEFKSPWHEMNDRNEMTGKF